MAGSFPDVPAPKLYYHDDGSVGFAQLISTGTLVAANTTQLTQLNGENSSFNSLPYGNTYRAGIIFPYLVDLKGIYLLTNGSHVGSVNGIVRTSVDTSNGADGTWVEQRTDMPVFSLSDVGAYLWRTDIEAVDYTGIKSVTVSTASSHGSKRQLHLYGEVTAGQALDKLEIWDPTLDQIADAAIFDYGDQARTTTQTVQFRVRNTSVDLTADSVTISADALYVPSPTLGSQTTFSDDDISYTSTVNIGSLAPETTSSVLYARLALGSTAVGGLWRQRFLASTSTWS